MPHTAHSADEIIVDFVPGSHSWAPLLSHTTFRSLAVTPSHLPVLNGVNDPTCFSFSPQTYSETGQSTSHQAHDLPRSIFCILAYSLTHIYANSTAKKAALITLTLPQLIPAPEPPSIELQLFMQPDGERDQFHYPAHAGWLMNSWCQQRGGGREGAARGWQ